MLALDHRAEDPASVRHRADRAVALSVGRLTKRFGTTLAVHDVSLDVEHGEIHCILGENGAGKSTLAACICGLMVPDLGTVEVDGTPVALTRTTDAITAGIAMVHQHFVLVPGFTIAENVVVGTGRGLWIDRLGAYDRIKELSNRFGFDVDPTALVDDLPVGTRQWVEIIKALYLGARVLILDEPTAVLTPKESARLFRVMRELTAEGIAIVLITHKMDEVMQSDRVTVLRRGRAVATLATAGADRDALVKLIVGRAVETADQERSSAPGAPVLTLSGAVATAPNSAPVDLSVAAGEIVGIAGVTGSGQDALLEMVCGLRPVAAGTVMLAGQDVTHTGAAGMTTLGVGYIPGDRLRDGLVPQFSIAENLFLGAQWSAPWRRGFLLSQSRLVDAAAEIVRRYAIAALGPQVRAEHLSGGNAQKVIVAREVAKATRLLLCNQPTRGVDVGAVEFILKQILARRDAGCAVVIASEELDQLMQISDRIAVMYAGRIIGVVTRHDFDLGTIGSLMAGLELDSR